MIRLRFFSIVIAFMLLMPAGLLAAEKNQNQNKPPAFIEADSMHYDEDTHTVSAVGNVQITQGKRVLIADKVTYNQNSNEVKARGHISLMEPDGMVFFAKEADLRDDLKSGVINQFKARLNDNSLFSAKKASRKDGYLTFLEKAVYSPCPVCIKDLITEPQWQIKSRTVTIDEKEERVVHHNAFFEIYGVPVVYTPYISHATPNAHRKSGFLMPSYGNDTNLGEYIRVPYYYNIAPEQDATFSAQANSLVDPVFTGQYRRLTEDGHYELFGSITHTNQFTESGAQLHSKEFRGHISGSGEFNLENQWIWGFEGVRSSDDTYLRKYHFESTNDTLVSRLYSWKTEGDNFISLEGLSFQGLNATDDPSTTPLVLPFARMHVESDPGIWQSKTALNANALVLYRSQGVKTNRLSATGSWSVPYITHNGQILEFKTSLRGDGYIVQDEPTPSRSATSQFSGATGRLIPQAELNWRYPFVQRNRYGRTFVEPVVNMIISPRGNNPDKIPNEDSQDVEFSDENLFNTNHFTGYDLVEGGPRTNYGIRGGLQTDNYGAIHALFGQSYRATSDSDFSSKSGLNDHFSDYVGQISYRFDSYFTGAYQFRINKNALSFSKNEVNATVNVQPLSFNVNYLSLDDSNIADTSSTLPTSKEVMTMGSALQLSKYWKITANANRNIKDGEWVTNNSSLVYDGPCTTILMNLQKDFTHNRDVQSATTISFQVLLKNF